MSVLQECMDKFSKKLSVILDAQEVSVTVWAFDLLPLHTVSILVVRLISCSMWSNKAAAHCRTHCVWHLTAIYDNVSVCVSCHLAGSDWDHTEISQDEAAELCERVSELLWRPSMFVSSNPFVFGSSLPPAVMHSATFFSVTHSPACLPTISRPHEINIRGLWAFIFLLLILSPEVCCY